MMAADRTRSLMTLPAGPMNMQQTTRRAASTSELLSTVSGSSATARTWQGSSAGSPVSEYNTHAMALPAGYTMADFAQARFIATAGSSSTYDSGSGSEAGTPSECDLPVHEAFPPLYINPSAANAAAAAAAEPQFVAQGVQPARNPPVQNGIFSSEPDISLLHSLFDVLQEPEAIDADGERSPNYARHTLLTMPSPKAERRAMFLHRDSPPTLDSGGPAQAARPVLDMANDLRSLTVTPRSANFNGNNNGSGYGYGVVDDVSALKYFGGVGVGEGNVSGGGGSGGGGGGGGGSAGGGPGGNSGTPGPSLFSPLFVTSPSSGAFASLPLFSPTGTSTGLPFSPMLI